MKYFFIIVILTTILQAKDMNLRLESSIYYTLFTELTHSKKPKIYLQDDVLSIQKFSSNFHILENCQDADIIIVTHQNKKTQECKDKMFFGTRHQALASEDVVGAFFWQKGRPNILFYKTRLDKYNITLDKHFQKYIDYEK